MAERDFIEPTVVDAELRLRVLGAFALERHDGPAPLTPRSRKARAVLAIAALARAPVPRAHLKVMLWGDRAEEQASASLRQALYELREVTARGALVPGRDAVAVNPELISSDFARIGAAVAHADAEALAAELAATAWPPLADLDDVTPELDDWLRDERARIAGFLSQKAGALAELALADGRPELAQRIAESLERVDPCDERAARVAIQAALDAGDRTGASRRHARLRERMATELGLAPGFELDGLLGAEQVVSTPRVGPSAVAQPTRKRHGKLVAACLALIAVLGVAAWFAFRPTPAEAQPRIAVLPFDGLGRADETYFASGVSDEILNLLSHQTGFKVVGRMSAQAIARRPDAIEEARRLGITHVLDGTARRAGNRLLITVRLSAVSDGTQIWSERFERPAGEVFAVQDDIASAVAGRLATSLGRAAVQKTSPEVYDRYLAARQMARERREPTLREAARLLREAIDRDPGYAPAYAELSQVTMLLADHPTSYGDIPIAKARADATRLARRALALDPNLGDAYAAMGFIWLSSKRSEPYYRKAVALSPQRPEFHRWLAQSLLELHRYDEAVAEYRRAAAIDPLWGLNYEHLVGALDMVGRKAEGQAYARRFLALDSDRRARLQFEKFLAGEDARWADELKYLRRLLADYPTERNYRFGAASLLASLGEPQAALRLYGEDPVARAVLSGDYDALPRLARAMGTAYWDDAHKMWGLERLLVADSQEATIVGLYDRGRQAVARGELSRDQLASPYTVLALRRAGRRDEAQALIEDIRGEALAKPEVGELGNDRRYMLAVIDLLEGRPGPALAYFLERSRIRPLELAEMPAMPLSRDPLLAPYATDPRLAAVDRAVFAALNAERRKAGFVPLSRATWDSAAKRF